MAWLSRRKVGASAYDRALGRRKDAGDGESRVMLSAYRDMQSQQREILAAAKHGPLQSLTSRELDAREQPMTIYPRPKLV